MGRQSIDMTMDGVEFSVAAWVREGRGAPIVFLHGFGSTKEDYLDAAMPGRFPDRILISLDAPGCGETRCEALDKLSIPLMRDVTAGVLRRLGVVEHHLVGHSMGGLTGLLLADLQKTQTLSFTSIEGNLASVDCFFSRQIIEHAEEDNGDFLRGFQERTFAGGDYSSALYASSVIHKVRADAVAPIFRSMVALSDSGELMQMFLGLPFPKMFMYGAANRSLPYLADLAARDVRRAEIPESAHFPMYSNPPAMWSSLRAFIDDVENGDAK